MMIQRNNSMINIEPTPRPRLYSHYSPVSGERPLIPRLISRHDFAAAAICGPRGMYGGSAIDFA